MPVLAQAVDDEAVFNLVFGTAMIRLSQRWLAVPLLAASVSSCAAETFSDAEKRAIASLSLASLPPLPANPSNKYADDPAAAAFGATLFFDQRLSANGAVSCGSCHMIDRQFQDDLPRGKGVGTGNRRTMPLAGVAWSPWLFWDGRRDSLWAQALTPLENVREQGGTRTAYAHFVRENFAERYQRIFGENLPDLSGIPTRAGPFGTDAEKAAWNSMAEARKQDVDRIFANLGKAIEAFERSIAPSETRFDRFAKALADGRAPEGDAALRGDEIAGLRLFIGKAQCSICHAGPRLTDDSFHNTGVPPAPGLPEDLGREAGVAQVKADLFNCLGKFSDAAPGQCVALRVMAAKGPELTRAYKTPSLRGAATRPPYMHSGQIATLEAVVDHYAAAPASVSGISEIRPITLSGQERRQLVAFLKTLAE